MKQKVHKREPKQRQAMSVSPYELRKLADELEKQGRTFCKGLDMTFDPRKKFSVSIINRSKCSDTWRFE